MSLKKGAIGDDLPTVTLHVADVLDGITVAQLFVRAGLSASGKEAKRLILEGGARLNDEPVMDAGQKIHAADLIDPIKLTAGRKRHALVMLD